jgi:hypothetical protein
MHNATHYTITNSKTTFPENISNNQFCRYLYYMGRIGALQLDYSDAHTKLMQSSRKAPQNTALPFRIACQKLMIIVQLLLGEVPERGVFNQSGFRGPLLPYLQLTQAVRLGDLIEFNHAVEQVRTVLPPTLTTGFYNAHKAFSSNHKCDVHSDTWLCEQC